MRNIRNIFAILLLSTVGVLNASEWYEGGTLSDESALIWQGSTLANKIATSSDFVATMYQKKMFVASISSSIKNVNDLAPYAIQLASCIDEAAKRDPDPAQNKKMYTNQQVSSMAVLCAATMGWVQ